MAGKAKHRRLEREKDVQAELSATAMALLRERVRARKAEQAKTSIVVSYEEFQEITEAAKKAGEDKGATTELGS